MFKFLPSMKSTELIAIEFGETLAKFAHMRVSGYRTEIRDVQYFSLIDKKEAEVVSQTRSVIEKMKPRQAQVINIICARQVITKNIEIPSCDQAEIKEIVNLQAGRHTPYSREEIVSDYINLGMYKHSYSKVLLLIASRNVIKRSVDLIQKAGVRLHRVVFAPEGIALSAQKLLKIDAHNAVPSVVVDVDENTTDFLIVYHGKALFSRSLPLGYQELINDKQKYIPRFVEEVKKSIEAYQNEDIERKPAELAIVGAAHVQQDLKEALENTISLKVTAPSCCKNLSVPAAVRATLESYGRGSFLGLIATGCAAEELHVDLTPEEIKLRTTVEERGRELIKTGILVIILSVAVSCVFLSTVFFKRMYLAGLTEQYNHLMAQVNELEDDFEYITLIRNYMTERARSVETVAALHDVAPLDLQLTDIRYEGDGTIRVRGTADSMSTVFSFSENMERSKFFEDVKTRNSVKRKEQEKDVTDFEISASLGKERQ